MSYKVSINTNDLKEALDCLSYLENENDEEFPKEKILSERAWVSYSFLDEIAKNEAEKKELINSCVKMIQDAIAINENLVDARTRLGTLIHIYSKTYLVDLQKT